MKSIIVGHIGPMLSAAALRALSRGSDCIIVALANETDGPELVVIDNEYQVGADGWVKIAPYGDHLKERTVRDGSGRLQQEAFVQRLDRAAADEMVSRFNSLWGKVKRFVVGVPIFKRHPDLGQYSPKTVTGLANDKNQYGMFSALEARDDGFYGRPVVSKAGQVAIENEGLKYLSPFWWAKQVGETATKIKIVSPFELISAGLTDRPNIPGGEALANAKNNQQKENDMDKSKLRAALVAAGIVALANDATDEQFIKAIEDLGKKASGATALENEKQTLTTAKANAESALQTEKTARENAERQLTETKTALANEKKARVALILDHAIADGRITPAQRPQWATDLEALSGTAFDQKVTALANEKPQMNTRTRTGNLGQRNSNESAMKNVQDQVLALANERMATAKCSWNEAWKWVQREKPDLFKQLQDPSQS